MEMAPYFEAGMLACFGAAWPAAIVKTLRAKQVEGISILFLWLVFAGYASGMAFKLIGIFDWVFVLYALNFSMVGTEIVLYYRYRNEPLAPQA